MRLTVVNLRLFHIDAPFRSRIENRSALFPSRVHAVFATKSLPPDYDFTARERYLSPPLFPFPFFSPEILRFPRGCLPRKIHTVSEIFITKYSFAPHARPRNLANAASSRSYSKRLR
ncbi:hypothetical protein PUN28_003265 [Cardiocondyla obscurior]|uniref:Uncharacterized protein n=1 Tax=Cardiocondyla obscurior TaxID=286306 RepID=A0AAW2GMU7_9HYME